MDKQRKREQQRSSGLRLEFPQVRAQESSRIRPRLGSQHLPIPTPLQTQPIPEPPEPKLDLKYLYWLDEQKGHYSKIESLSKSVGRLNKKSMRRNPIVILKDYSGNAAVYGLYKGQAIHGPVNWDQFYSTWDRVGEKYKEKPQPRQPFIQEYIEFLREKGFRFVGRIGKGSYGEVWRVNATLERERRLDSGQTQKGKVTLDLACKILSLEKFSNYPDIKKAVFMIVKEAEIHRKLNHENVVKVEEFIQIYDDVSEFPRPIFICLFMELCDGVLSHLIRTSPENRLSEDKAREWFKQISEGLRYLHEHNVVHLDLKPNNILFKRNSSGSFIYKLSDFGLSLKWKSGFLKRFNVAVGAMRYRAPEMNQKVPLDYETEPADIYSLGVCLVASVSGFLYMNVLMNLITSGEIYDQNAYETYGISRDLTHLLTAMTRPNPTDRPNIQQVTMKISLN